MRLDWYRAPRLEGSAQEATPAVAHNTDRRVAGPANQAGRSSLAASGGFGGPYPNISPIRPKSA
jgi:hypothetical protein